MIIKVTGSQWVDVSGWSYTEDLDPMEINSMDELKEAAKLYAAEFAKNYNAVEGTDYRLRFYGPEDEYISPLAKIWLSEVPSMAVKCLAAIREYYEGLTGNANEWSDVITGSEVWSLDEKATAAADISGMSETAIFMDGSRLEWNGDEWEVK